MVLAFGTVVADWKAFWRTAPSVKTDSARLTGSPNVFPPSVDVAMTGWTGSAFAPVNPGCRRPEPT